MVLQLQHAVDAKKVGNGKIYSAIINQIIDLQTIGISIVINGENKIVYFSLLAVTGDNVGMHDIFGFKNFRGEYACRFCTSKAEVRKRQTSENHRTLRAPSDRDDMFYFKIY